MAENEPRHEAPRRALTGQESYKLLTDTVSGPNVRLKDNLYQGLAILACVVLGAAVGFLAMANGLAGAAVGGGIGLVVGLFGSGLFLMIYRGVRHARGKHD